ncbi:MAG: carbohydrate-binding family 9-like protein [Myxococcales bacterium]|nr:carbohydrate-binding family 9-like protein [Myxococcota bacterium]MDW8284227.1 carbohydrate-binding family 9-like protein [Myxococcales bacterium]
MTLLRAALCSLPPLLGVSLLVTGCVEQQSPDTPTEEDIKAARQEHVLKSAPNPQFPVGAVLTAPAGQGRGKVVYLGMDVDPPTVPAGQTFTLTHYFRVEEPVSEGWRLFVHLAAPADRRSHLNADHVPVGGRYPVPRWQKGEIIRDVHRVSLPTNWPGDKLAIYVGLWKGQLRFKVQSGPNDGQDRVMAATVPVSGGAAAPQAPETKRLVARRLAAGTVITVDGKLDEPAWKTAPSTGPFVSTLNGAPAEQAAEARVLWDDKHLYVAFEFADKDVWGSLTRHDDKLWTQEAAELFIDADGDGKTYIELQVSPRNVTFDSWLPAYRQNDNAWDAPVKTAVQVRGTLDKRDDVDQGWTVEMAIPHEVARGRLAEMKNVPPTVGTQWRVNFFRMDMPAGKPQVASAWSPPLVPDFHALDRFGTLIFGDEGGNPPPHVESVVAPRPVVTHPINPVLRKLMLAHPDKPPPPEGERPAANPPAKKK